MLCLALVLLEATAHAADGRRRTTPPAIVRAAPVSRSQALDPVLKAQIQQVIDSAKKIGEPAASPETIRALGASILEKGSPLREAIAYDLAWAEPDHVAELRYALERQAPVVRNKVLVRADQMINRRMKDRISLQQASDIPGPAGGLDAYDDVLRRLAYRGFLGQELIYPLNGLDFLPSRWTIGMIGLNWEDYRPLFGKIARRAGRAAYAKRIKEAWQADVVKVKDAFDEKTLSRFFEKNRQFTSRTLILKYADQYRADHQIEEGVNAKGLLRYADWLALLVRREICPGDYVVLLSRDPLAEAFFKASRTFKRIPFHVPALEPLEGKLVTITRARGPHGEDQALYLPNAVSVFVKR